MNKIKITGLIIFILLIILAVISKNISEHNNINNNFLETINSQKSLAQDISKHIFYIFKRNNTSTQQLDDSIKIFLNSMHDKDTRDQKILSNELKIQNKRILFLWNKFYLDVQEFRNNSKATTAYSSILLNKIVKDIYIGNLNLMVEFDKLILIHKENFYNVHYKHTLIQYFIFLILLISLIYLLIYISKTSNNLDKLMNKIDSSIESIDQVESDTQNVLDDIELCEDEDIIINALDELMISSIKLKKLKLKLESLNKLK